MIIFINNINKYLGATYFLFAFSLLSSAQGIDKNIDSLILSAYDLSSTNYSKAFSLVDSALNQSIAHSYAWGEAEALRVKGLTLFYAIQYSQALKLFIESKEKFQALGDTIGVCNANNLIATVYDYQGFNKKAILKHQENLELRRAIGDINGLSATLNNIAVNLRKIGETQKALEYYLLAINLILNSDDLRSLSRSYNNVGLVFLELNELDSAFKYLNKALEIREKLTFPQDLKNTYQGLGSYYFQAKNLKKARDYFEKSFLIANEIGIVYEIESAAKDLSQVYYQMGQYKKAYDTHLIYKQMSDSLKNKETIQLLTSMEMESKFEKERELQKLIQEKKDADNQLIMVKQKRFRNILVLVIVALLVIALLIFKGFIEKTKHNRLLTIQNEEILQQKEEISTQRDEIESQKEEIEAQRDLLIKQKLLMENKNQKLTDSLEYARSIQGALLPWTGTLHSLIGDHFILYKPKDIVSGDFYWASDTNDGVIVCVADCTGHGVPGAFMSVLGISLLSEIVQKDRITQPNLILNKLREYLIYSLRQDETHSRHKEGMTIAICHIDRKKGLMKYAGASMPMILIRHTYGTPILERLHPDGMPIGISPRMRDFTQKEYTISNGDMLYLYSDGYADQFGGTEGKKLKIKPFLSLLENNSTRPLAEQQQILESNIKNWINESNPVVEQFDDITILGIRI